MRGIYRRAGLAELVPSTLPEALEPFAGNAEVLDPCLRGERVVVNKPFGSELKVVTGCEPLDGGGVALRVRPYAWQRPAPGEPGIF